MMHDDDDSSSVMSPSMDETQSSMNQYQQHPMVTPLDNHNTNHTTPNDDNDTDMGIKDPADNDVLCGRGGSINSHPGNERFRTLVEKRKRVYLTARFKREKRLIANSIVSEIRAIHGRFLQRDPKSGLWKDIGDEKARDKTSQALRENAPSIRAEIEDEINEHRAELYKDEVTASSATGPHSPYLPPPPPPPPTSSGYYSNGWYPSFYPYPPPVHGSHPYPPHPGYPPPPPHNHHHHHHPGYDYNNNSSSNGYHTNDPYGTTANTAPSSKRNTMIEQTADLVTSGAEALRSWTKASFSFGGGNSVSGGNSSTHHHNDNATVNTGTSSKPISYKHGDDRRKIVKFRDDKYSNNKRQRVRPSYSPLQNGHHQHSSSHDDYEEDLEPQSVDVATNASLMSQVANHILGSLGSWDGHNMCGNSSTVYDADGKVPMPIAQPSEYTQDTEMGVEWEGQEVQLVVDDKRDEMRMPPPAPAPPQHHHTSGRDSHTGTSIAFSSLGSCHSWLPEQMAAASSYFSGRDDTDHNSFANHSNSMVMDMAEYSATGSIAHTMENYSVTGESIGGSSLTKVFEQEHQYSNNNTHHHHHNHHQYHNGMQSPNMSHRDLQQIPSWERSLRSKSPLSLGDDDDVSLISKTSSKGALSSVPSMGDEMAWTRE